MKGKFKALGIVASVLVLLASLAVPLVAISVEAHAPSGAKDVGETELLPIWIYGENEELQKFVIEDNDVRGYTKGMKPIETDMGEILGKCPDGELRICDACVFRVMQVAISQLSPDEIPNQADFGITWTHPSLTHEKTFRYITGGIAEYYHNEIPEGTSRKHLVLENYKYAFTLNDETFETEVLDGVFPEGFFETRDKVKSGEATDGEKAEFNSLWEEAREKFLTLDADELFIVPEEEEEPAPVWPIIFTFGLIAAVIGATVYSTVKRG